MSDIPSFKTINGETIVGSGDIVAGQFYGIDQSRIIASLTINNTTSYTTSEDCWVTIWGVANDTEIQLNGVAITGRGNSASEYIWLPLKKNDRLSIWRAANMTLKAFGLK